MFTSYYTTILPLQFSFLTIVLSFLFLTNYNRSSTIDMHLLLLFDRYETINETRQEWLLQSLLPNLAPGIKYLPILSSPSSSLLNFSSFSSPHTHPIHQISSTNSIIKSHITSYICFLFLLIPTPSYQPILGNMRSTFHSRLPLLALRWGLYRNLSRSNRAIRIALGEGGRGGSDCASQFHWGAWGE